MIEQEVKSSSEILFLFVSGYLSFLLFTRSCGWLMAQIWHSRLNLRIAHDNGIYRNTTNRCHPNSAAGACNKSYFAHDYFLYSTFPPAWYSSSVTFSIQSTVL